MTSSASATGSTSHLASSGGHLGRGGFMIRKQLGVTLSGAIIWMVILALGGLFAAKLMPSYLEFFAVKKIFERPWKRTGETKGTVRDIRNAFDRRNAIEDVKALRGDGPRDHQGRRRGGGHAPPGRRRSRSSTTSAPASTSWSRPRSNPVVARRAAERDLTGLQRRLGHAFRDPALAAPRRHPPQPRRRPQRAPRVPRRQPAQLRGRHPPLRAPSRGFPKATCRACARGS